MPTALWASFPLVRIPTWVHVRDGDWEIYSIPTPLKIVYWSKERGSPGNMKFIFDPPSDGEHRKPNQFKITRVTSQADHYFEFIIDNKDNAKYVADFLKNCDGPFRITQDALVLELPPRRVAASSKGHNPLQDFKNGFEPFGPVTVVHDQKTNHRLTKLHWGSDVLEYFESNELRGRYSAEATLNHVKRKLNLLSLGSLRSKLIRLTPGSEAYESLKRQIAELKPLEVHWRRAILAFKTNRLIITPESSSQETTDLIFQSLQNALF